MADDTPILPAEPVLTSPVYIGAVITILSTLAGLAPLHAFFTAIGLTDSTAIATNVNAGAQVFALLAAIFTARARKNSKIAPLTYTKAGAANHPNTLAANAAPPPAAQPTI